MTATPLAGFREWGSHPTVHPDGTITWRRFEVVPTHESQARQAQAWFEKNFGDRKGPAIVTPTMRFLRRR